MIGGALRRAKLKDDSTPLQRELRQLERESRVSPLRLETAGIFSAFGCSACFAIAAGFIQHAALLRSSFDSIYLPLLAGLLVFLLLLADIGFRQYPALLRRQELLVQELRQAIFEGGLLLQFVELEDARAEKAARESASLAQAVRSLALPLASGSLLERFAAHAYGQLRGLPQFAEYRHDQGEIEMRAAIKLAIVQELKREADGDESKTGARGIV